MIPDAIDEVQNAQVRVSAIKVIANPTSHRESSNTNHDVKNGISSGVVSGFSAGSHIRVMVYTRPSSSTRPTRRWIATGARCRRSLLGRMLCALMSVLSPRYQPERQRGECCDG